MVISTAIERSIRRSQDTLNDLLDWIANSGGFTRERYVRFLNMQYHLVRNVQSHFYAVAGNARLMNYKGLREFLVRFAHEEELHYLLAQKDLEHLGEPLQECPKEVVVWRRFYESTMEEYPFWRLGATVILENIAGASDAKIVGLMAQPFINPKTSVFLTVHRHRELNHGDQVLEAFASAKLSAADLSELEYGAELSVDLYTSILEAAVGARRVFPKS